MRCKQLGMQRSASQRKAKKVCIPTVPSVENPQTHQGMFKSMPINSVALKPMSNFSQWMITQENGHCDSVFGQQITPKMNTLMENNSDQYGVQQMPVINNAFENQHSATAIYAKHVINGHQISTNSSNSTFCPNVIINSPLRHRNSTGSTSSHSSSGFESMRSGSQVQSHAPAGVNNLLRGDSPPSRNSIHSSSGSSSLGSLERLDETSCSINQMNFMQMMANGVSDNDIISAWLHNLHYEDYTQMFLQAGYDLATTARMTPEDLTAIGITKPGHRKRLTTEIHKMNVVDCWPAIKPATVNDWLSEIGLEEYIDVFAQQGYCSMDQMMQQTWEDFEDIGVKKLGHLKKLTCAIKKLKDARSMAAKQRTLDNASVDSLSGASCSSISSSMSHGGGGVAMIALTNHRTNVDARDNQSPYAMVTFQQSPKALSQSQEFSTYIPRSNTPNRHCPVTSVGSRHCGAAAPEGNDDNAFGAGRFGAPSGCATRRFPSCDGPMQSSLDCSGSTAAMASLSCENLIRKSSITNGERVAADTMTYDRRKSIQHHAYSYMTIGQQGSSPIHRPPSNQYLNHAHFSNESLGRCSPSTNHHQAPPKKPPPPTSSCSGVTKTQVFQLSAQTLFVNGGCDDQDDSAYSTSIGCGAGPTDLSPAHSVDEFPPPPEPITCEQHIKHLRMIRGNQRLVDSVGGAIGSTLGRSQDNGTSKPWRTDDRQSTSDGEWSPASVPKKLAGGVRNSSTASIDSGSSAETLPFAQENVGTIRSKIQPQDSGPFKNTTSPHFIAKASPVRPALASIFPTNVENERSAKPANVLNDIGFMLQDLTEQLDAMLCEPTTSALSKSQKVN